MKTRKFPLTQSRVVILTVIDVSPKILNVQGEYSHELVPSQVPWDLRRTPE